MASPQDSFDVPYRDPVVDSGGMLSVVWTQFFRAFFERLMPLGSERSFTLANNQAAPADVVGLSFSSRAVSQAVVEFLVQRVTTDTGAIEKIETGSFTLSYNPTANDWNIALTQINLPDNSGVDFTVTAAGQVQYTSTNETGTPSISRVIWRSRVLAGKSAQYSSQAAP